MATIFQTAGGIATPRRLTMAPTAGPYGGTDLTACGIGTQGSSPMQWSERGLAQTTAAATPPTTSFNTQIHHDLQIIQVLAPLAEDDLVVEVLEAGPELGVVGEAV